MHNEHQISNIKDYKHYKHYPTLSLAVQIKRIH